jgi:hypothetical protein
MPPFKNILMKVNLAENACCSLWKGCWQPTPVRQIGFAFPPNVISEECVACLSFLSLHTHYLLSAPVVVLCFCSGRIVNRFCSHFLIQWIGLSVLSQTSSDPVCFFPYFHIIFTARSHTYFSSPSFHPSVSHPFPLSFLLWMFVYVPSFYYASSL